jgi:hypothetical protein
MPNTPTTDAIPQPNAAAAAFASDPEARRQIAAYLGSVRTEAKARAARENGRKGGRSTADFTPEIRAKQSAGAKAAWERRKAAGNTRTGPAPKPLSEFPCTCTGGDSEQAADHLTRCPKGRAIRHREQKASAQDER